MADQIKELIDKIQQEGVEAAQAQAEQITQSAQAKAQEIIAKAKKDADKLILEAREEISRTEHSSKTALEQAGRNLLLKLKEEINATLKRIILLNLRQVLSPAELSSLILKLVKVSGVKDRLEIVVSLNKRDLVKIEQDFLGKLKAEIKKGLCLRAAEDIRGGFVISYDQGRSHFDFTDERLAEYIGAYLAPKLSRILNSAAQTGKKPKK
jgi:V/A-type H+-transporting ATPase subunit E